MFGGRHLLCAERCGEIAEVHEKKQPRTAEASKGARAARQSLARVAERSEAVRWNRFLGPSARFKLPADVYGQDLVFAFLSFA